MKKKKNCVRIRRANYHFLGQIESRQDRVTKVSVKQRYHLAEISQSLAECENFS